jgi:hypothetical protein
MKEIFPIASASESMASWLVILLFLAVPIVLVAYFLWSPRIVRFEVSPEGLRIRGDLFYSLKDGEKALVFIGGSSRVAYIPARSGYSVMLSAAEPERLIAALSC